MRTDLKLIAIFGNLLQTSLTTKIEMFIGPTTSLWFKYLVTVWSSGSSELQRRPVGLCWVKRHCTGQYWSTALWIWSKSFWCVVKYWNNKTIYVKQISLLYKLGTCFDPYRVIIRPSYCIIYLKRCSHYWDPNNVSCVLKKWYNKKDVDLLFHSPTLCTHI